MNTFLILLQKELRSFFVSPLAYTIMAVVMVLNGVLFRMTLAAMNGKVSQQSLLYLVSNDTRLWIIFFVLFPLITMRLFAEEKKLGTLETLLTAPVSTSSVILGKYTATLIFYCVLWLPSVLNLLAFEWVTTSSPAFNAGSFWGTYLILFLFGAFNIAMGCFASALTNNQLVAGVVSLSLVTLHFFLGSLLNLVNQDKLPQSLIEGLKYFSTPEHLYAYSQGLIDTRPLIYYPTASCLFLCFTYYVLEFRRWRP